MKAGVLMLPLLGMGINTAEASEMSDDTGVAITSDFSLLGVAIVDGISSEEDNVFGANTEEIAKKSNSADVSCGGD